MPVHSRSRSAAAVRNDKKILDAAIAEGARVGLDGLGFGAIAERAGLTTGAMYGRFVDVRDMTAALWIERLNGATLNLLSEVVETFVSRPGTCGADLLPRVRKLSNPEVVGLEAMMIARRVPELDEVLTDDVRAALTSLGLGAGNDNLEQVRIVLALSSFFGCVVNSYFEKDLDVWKDIFNVMSLTASMMKPVKSKSKPLGKVDQLTAETDSDLRNILIDAAAEVIARSGVSAATVARIARKSRMTSGALYTLYTSRDELLLDAMEHLLAQAAAGTTAIVKGGEQRDAVAEATANLVELAFVPSRAQWRRFRLETYVAARTDRDVAGVVRRIQRLGAQRYRALFTDNPNVPAGVVEMLARFGQNHPMGLSVLEPYWDHLGALNYMPYTEALLEVRQVLS